MDGGSALHRRHLFCVRGGWAELENLPMNAEAKLAASQARAFDYNAARYPGFFASRRNSTSVRVSTAADNGDPGSVVHFHGDNPEDGCSDIP
jgi:hypothetical protein